MQVTMERSASALVSSDGDHIPGASAPDWQRQVTYISISTQIPRGCRRQWFQSWNVLFAPTLRCGTIA